MKELFRLQEAIERQRNMVNEMIELGTDDEAFVRANHKLDRLIEEYIELEIQAANHADKKIYKNQYKGI